MRHETGNHHRKKQSPDTGRSGKNMARNSTSVLIIINRELDYAVNLVVFSFLLYLQIENEAFCVIGLDERESGSIIFDCNLL